MTDLAKALAWAARTSQWRVLVTVQRVRQGAPLRAAMEVVSAIHGGRAFDVSPVAASALIAAHEAAETITDSRGI